jgi:hypothetical protein
MVSNPQSACCGSSLEGWGHRRAFIAKPEQRVPGKNAVVVTQPGGDGAVAMHPVPLRELKSLIR